MHYPEMVHRKKMLQTFMRCWQRLNETAVCKEGNGLWNYKTRVDSMNGLYTVKTSPGNGTKIFVIFLIATFKDAKVCPKKC